MYHVYILECADGSYYIGSTNNIERRLHQHNHLKSGAHYTKIRRPVIMKYVEDCNSVGDARRREAELKRMPREKKIALLHLL
jgi:putative endonuclease